MKRAFVGSPISEEGNRHPVCSQSLGGQRHSCRDGDIGPNDGDGRNHPHINITDVHGATFGLATTGAFGKQLGHNRPRRDALGDGVTVGPMGTQRVVVGTQMGTDTGSNRLLPNVEVQRRGNAPLHKKIVAPLLEAANGEHGAVHF